MRVRLSEAAHADLDDIFLYVAIDAPLAAERLMEQLLDATIELGAFPLIGRVAENGRRELVTIRPYVIVYFIDGSVVSVERIIHSARRR